MKSKPATSSQSKRMRLIAEAGCLVCDTKPCQVHHLLSGGVRRGHDYTIGLCEFHHTESAEYSYHRNKKAFHARHGNDETLLFKQAQKMKFQPTQPPATKILPRRS